MHMHATPGDGMRQKGLIRKPFKSYKTSSLRCWRSANRFLVVFLTMYVRKVCHRCGCSVRGSIATPGDLTCDQHL